MNAVTIHIILAVAQLLITCWAWRLINLARVRPVEKVHAEPVEDFPELFPQYRAELERRKAPTYRQTQASAAAFVIEMQP